jgi:divalent metal cation (Fe/Co/Zn/Cd) transporter
LICGEGFEMADDWAALKKQRWLLRGIHVWVDPAISVYEGHQIGHKVKDQIMASEGLVQDVTVHIEPATPDLTSHGYFDGKLTVFSHSSPA